MELALALGRRMLGRAWPNPAVGALVVADGSEGRVIVGRGWTQDGGRPHAETEALRRAGRRARGATLYVSLEPCSHHGRTPPCAEAIVAAGIARVVTALEDPDQRVSGRGHDILRRKGIAVDIGLCAKAARVAHAGHIRRVTDARPHVTLKLAVSADGKVGAPGHRPVALTGPTASDRVHLLRAEADAIMVGIGTVLSDDPQLTCRLPGMARLSPIRVVLDGELRLPLGSRLVKTARQTPVWVFARTFASPEREQKLRDAGVEIFRVGDAGPGRLSVGEALMMLSTLGITRVLSEGGPRVAASLLRADLVDEAVVITTPMNLGPDAVPALDKLPLSALTSASALELIATETLGPDTLTHLFRKEV
jgi:diaminohydroxyphosphoribosylaminopyrimidine deaminase/5-amino-6-(5-phosphoribosylamino)uracil reductase